jgi:hypothetical protein
LPNWEESRVDSTVHYILGVGPILGRIVVVAATAIDGTGNNKILAAIELSLGVRGRSNYRISSSNIDNPSILLLDKFVGTKPIYKPRIIDNNTYLLKRDNRVWKELIYSNLLTLLHYYK